ncbi:MAG: hypothetical protein KatS3mg061_0546 [Dehalococcoidia bacterium]|nr:MAG: hypothetical protein KatS3mg061_0546 [Dehalococcoidia bacterium]
MATGPVRNFRVNLTSWGIAGIQPEEILATSNVTHTLTLYGAGFTSAAEVLLETRFISLTVSGPVTQTVQKRPAAVRVRSPEAIELDVNMTYPGPWDVVVRQNGEERRTRFWALPYFPLMRLSYERSPVFTPGRNWEHTLTLSNEGTASGVAIVALRPPTGTLLITTTLNSELLGHLDSPLGKVYFVATRVDPGATQQVRLVYNLPWSAVNVPNGLRLGDATDFAYYGVGQPLAELWNDLKDLAREGNESNAEGYLDDLLTLSLSATGNLQGWALQAFRELPDEDMAYGYLDRVARRYPWMADALMNEYLTDLRTLFEELLAQRQRTSKPEAVGSSRLATQSNGYSFKQWLNDVVGPDPWSVIKGTFSLKESWQSLTSGESAVFLIAEAEGAISNLTFGLLKPKLGAEWLAKNLCLNPDLVKAGRVTGEGLAFAATLPIPVKGGGYTSAFASSVRNTFAKMAKTPPKPIPYKYQRSTKWGAKYTYELVETRGNNLEPERWGYDLVIRTENVGMPGPKGFVMVGEKRVDSYNLFHWGKTAKGESHYGWLWDLKGVWKKDSDVLNDVIWFAGPHIYGNRLYIPWHYTWARVGDLEFKAPIGEIPINELRAVYAYGSTLLRGGSLAYNALTPIELQENEPGSQCQPLRGAYDPNEIVGLPASPFIRPNQDLDLTIHFENLRTATDPAETVQITMTVPAALDTATIQLVGSSHPVTATLDTDQRVLRFTFAGINLPPNRTPPEGEGWVRLRVQPRPGLTSGTQFSLQADIVFWAFGAPNPPIRTNVLTYTVDATSPEVRLQGARVEGSQVVLEVQGSDGHSGMRALRVLYTADERQWLLGDGRFYEPVRNTTSETIRFTPRLSGSIKVQVIGFDAMGYATATEPISLQVQGSGIYLPVVSK